MKDKKCADFMYKKPKRDKRQAKKVDSKSQEKPPENTIVIEIDDFEEEIGPNRIMDEHLQFPAKAKVTKILHDGDKAILRKMFEEEFSLSTVWRGDDHGNHIQLRDVFNLLRERDTSSSVLDGYAEIILREAIKEKKASASTCGKSFPKTCYVSSLGTEFIESPDALQRHNMLDRHILNATRSLARYVLFPINSAFRSDMSLRHWTLLVLDAGEGKWTFYNSLLPREGIEDHHLNKANSVKEYVEEFLRSCVCGKVPISQDEVKEIILESNSPQQRDDSVDCGIFVCYIMQRIANGLEVPSKFEPREVRSFRRDMVSMFLNDGDRSWKEHWNKE
ncbi:hypothetical protein L1049_015989 [Liquidambar formosana]|uniref:Ubiquitin-like protease family profile domain-containing protein n=1 Tax=Liquidambar formosana TaxID=63359 RepID=A0AAP0RYT2_LIQFO